MTQEMTVAEKLRVCAAVYDTFQMRVDRQQALALIRALEQEKRIDAEIRRMRLITAQLERSRDDIEKMSLRVVQIVLNVWMVSILLQWWLT